VLGDRGEKLICFVVLYCKEQFSLGAREDHLLELDTDGDEVDVQLDGGALWIR
jgi:hypothetical protein